MTLNELDEYLRSLLKIDNYLSDPSKNGVQVQNENPTTQEIKKIAFAVDACVESIEKAIACKAQVLIVHHGIFWGHEQRLVLNHYKRIKLLLENNIALYACHIPLDANEEVGNNYGLAKILGLTDLSSFGNWNNMNIGVKGSFDKEKTIENIKEMLFKKGGKPLATLAFGQDNIKSVAIVSGGAEDLLGEAIEGDVDLYITGEVSHESYHYAKESCINVIAGGHYNTETVGVSLLAEKVKKETNIETIFIDVPTGL